MSNEAIPEHVLADMMAAEMANQGLPLDLPQDMPGQSQPAMHPQDLGAGTGALLPPQSAPSFRQGQTPPPVPSSEDQTAPRAPTQPGEVVMDRGTVVTICNDFMQKLRELPECSPFLDDLDKIAATIDEAQYSSVYQFLVSLDMMWQCKAATSTGHGQRKVNTAITATQALVGELPQEYITPVEVDPKAQEEALMKEATEALTSIRKDGDPVPESEQNPLDPVKTLSDSEKIRLREDLLNLPPERLGEAIRTLHENQPEKLKRSGDEIELDIHKLDTHTQRQLQTFVACVNAAIEITSPSNMQGMMYNSSPRPRKRRRKRQRHPRTSYTKEQKAAMTDFWNRCNWEPCPNRVLLHQFCDAVGVTPHQMRIFRQNNRKKHMGMAWASMYGAMDPAFLNQVMNRAGAFGMGQGGLPPGMSGMPPMNLPGAPGMQGMPGMQMLPGMGMPGMPGMAGMPMMGGLQGMGAMPGMMPPEFGLAQNMMPPLPNGMQAPLPGMGLPLDNPAFDDSIQKQQEPSPEAGGMGSLQGDPRALSPGKQSPWVTVSEGVPMQAVSHER